ncbi:MAG: LytR family transcriptional regulator [Anaerolineaceae bacterium]|nr:MAG: LytR family transcriptional regulator [Anaerolineaceae bacterium]
MTSYRQAYYMTVKKGKRKIWLTTLLIIEAIFLILIILFTWGYKKLEETIDKIPRDISQDEEIIEPPEVIIPEGYKNFLIFGVDTRDNSLKKGNSDTIIVVSINNKTHDVKMVSIYRDTYAFIPNIGYDKINAAYANGGYSLAINTINLNYDLDIRKYVTVNFQIVVEAVDYLGGITLDITKEELKYLNGYVRELNKVNGTDVPGLKSAGTQNVNGTQATAYARIRYTAGGDFKRTERQRIVLDKMFEKAKKLGIAKLNKMVDKFLPMIYTNLSNKDIIDLLKYFFSYDIVEQTGFPFEKEAKTYQRLSYVFPINLYENVAKLHLMLFEEENYIPSANVQDYSSYIEVIRNN